MTKEFVQTILASFSFSIPQFIELNKASSNNNKDNIIESNSFYYEFSPNRTIKDLNFIF